MTEYDNLSQEVIRDKVYSLRSKGRIAEAIDLCRYSENRFPFIFSVPKVRGDLHLEANEFDEASKAYLTFLRKIPRGHKVFNDFAVRYNRLRRYLSKEAIASFALEIYFLVKNGEIIDPNSTECINLIQQDIPADIIKDKVSFPEVSNMRSLFKQGKKGPVTIPKIKNYASNNPVIISLLADTEVLNRKRTLDFYDMDFFIVSFYEKIKSYDKALKIANELVKLKQDPAIIRTIFRICREKGDYENADDFLVKFPDTLKSSNFNILYELVYYFEARDDIEQIHHILKKLETEYKNNFPVQRTVLNFYIRFGMIEEAERIKLDYRQLIYGPKSRTVQQIQEIIESEAGTVSKIKELYSKLEHSERLAAVSDLTRGISHELGQPITNIRYTVQYYKRALHGKIDKGDAIKKEDIESIFKSILEETDRMGGLIKRLSPITSIRSLIESYNVYERIKKRIQAENTKLVKSKIEVCICCKSDISIIGDPVKFDQIIGNLLLNSIDAINERKSYGRRQIEIRTDENKSFVNIVFSDTGVGIQAKHRGKIFDPFYSTKAPGKGEGLGLFIVWNLIKMQGGKIELARNTEGGARFIIAVPKKTEEGAESK